VTPLGVDPRFGPASPAAVSVARTSFGLQKPYILTVGTLEPRKNLPALVRAFATLRDDVPHDLVLAGPDGWLMDEIEATIRMVRETAPDDVGISVSYPLPGTRFHQIVSSELGLKKNWNDSGDLAMMFRGAYGTEFYRALASVIHAEVRGGDVTAAWQRLHAVRDSCEGSESVRDEAVAPPGYAPIQVEPAPLYRRAGQVEA